MTRYPEYVYKTLAQARDDGQWQAYQAPAIKVSLAGVR